MEGDRLGSTLVGARIDRRRFLGVSAGTVGAVAMGGFFARPASASDATALTSARRSTYRSLLRALRHQRDGEWRGRDAVAAERQFVGWYHAQPGGGRAQADFALDELGAAWSGKGGGDADRHRDLLRWSGATVSGSEAGSPSVPAARRRAAVAIAVALATVGTAPAPTVDEHDDLRGLEG